MKPKTEVANSKPANHASVCQSPYRISLASASFSRSAKIGAVSGFSIICTISPSVATSETDAKQEKQHRQRHIRSIDAVSINCIDDETDHRQQEDERRPFAARSNFTFSANIPGLTQPDHHRYQRDDD